MAGISNLKRVQAIIRERTSNNKLIYFSINQNQIVSDGAMFYRDTNGNVMCTHHSNGAVSSNDGSGNSAARKRPWFKYHAGTTETSSNTAVHARNYSMRQINTYSNC